MWRIFYQRLSELQVLAAHLNRAGSLVVTLACHDQDGGTSEKQHEDCSQAVADADTG